MKIFAFGASILTSYWNGAATYYRGVYKYLARRGHHITFASPDAFDRRQHHDVGDFNFVDAMYYQPGTGVEAMLELAASADVVVKHSGLGIDDALIERDVLKLKSHAAVIFWDVDAPATLARLNENLADPFRADVPLYDAIVTYGGGPKARDGYLAFGARAYHSIYNGLDPETHHPVPHHPAFSCDVAFLGNRLPDRETRVEELFLRAAELAPNSSFLLGGEGWSNKPLPSNVRYIGHVSTADHNRFNCSANMVININRSSMAHFGFSPPTRVFEVSGTGTCMLCDDWPGIDDCFEPEAEILVVRTAEQVVEALRNHDKHSRKKIGQSFRARALRDHTYAQRALQAEHAFLDCFERKGLKVALPAEPELEAG